MVDFLLLIVPLIAGIALGFVLGERKHVNLGRATVGIILVLIFSLGFSIGSNSELLGSLPNVGVNAIVITLLTIFFSVVFVEAARRLVGLK